MEQSNNGRSENVGCEDEGSGDGFWEMGWAGEMNGERFVCLRGEGREEDGYTTVVGDFI